MTDIVTMPDGSQWKPATTIEMVHCVHCDNAVDTPEEVATYPNGTCPDCGSSWTGDERRSTTVVVTVPEAVKSAV